MHYVTPRADRVYSKALLSVTPREDRDREKGGRMCRGISTDK